MPDLGAFFRSIPAAKFEAAVYRICPSRHSGNMLSMRGSFLHGARYNIRGYFGAVYTSLSSDTARREIGRYFTVAPIGGFNEASIHIRLNRVVDLSDRRLLRKAGIAREELTAPSHHATQEVGLRAWESGIEGLLVPSAAAPSELNLAVFVDNQQPAWKIELKELNELPPDLLRTSHQSRRESHRSPASA